MYYHQHFTLPDYLPSEKPSENHVFRRCFCKCINYSFAIIMNIPCHAVSHLCFKLKEFVSSILRHIHGGSKTYPIAIVLCFQHISKEQVLVSGDEMLILYTKNLLYGLACFSLNTSDIKSLDFIVTRFLMKLFKSYNII